MGNKLIENEKIKEILKNYKILWALKHAESLEYWDLETYIPKEGVEARGESISKLESIYQEIFLKEKFKDLIKDADKIKDLNNYEKAILRILKRNLKYYEKLPPEFIEEFTKLVNDSVVIWREAKNKNNFKLFEPNLKKIVEMSRKKAEYLGYKNSPYDALLDEFEENLTSKEVEKYFESIKEPIINLAKKIRESKNFIEKHNLEEEEYDIEKMKKFNIKLLEYLYGELNDLRLDISSHPFTINLGKGDTRITTRYEGKDFSRTYCSVIHEYGHALYDLQSDSNLLYTPIEGGSSLVIHESQSRFWENFIGRSKEFFSGIREEISQFYPEIKNYNLEEIHKYLNLVKPSLIRTEADEVTYHLHVLIRFEIEKDLIEGKIEVKDLPKIWNQKYKEYSPEVESSS